MRKQKIEIGDVVMIQIPEPNVTNYGFQDYNYQIGIVSEVYHGFGFYSYKIMLDFHKGLYKELSLIIGMYPEHVTLISKADFK